MINRHFIFRKSCWLISIKNYFLGLSISFLLMGCQQSLIDKSFEPNSQTNRSDAYTVDNNWPALPDGLSLGQAAGVEVDAHGHVFVFHRGSNSPGSTTRMKEDAVVILDSNTGQLVDSWGAGKFVIPHGIEIDSEGYIWLADVGLHQVFKFSHDGELLLTLGEAGVSGNDAEHFNMPTDIAVLSDGTFYVTDGYGNNRVMVFSAAGVLKDIWGNERGSTLGKFNLPHSIESDDKDRLYVADRSNQRIQVFSRNGEFIEQWRNPDWGTPYAIKILNDQIFIVDGGDLPGPVNRSRVYWVDNQGTIKDGFGRLGRYNGEFFVAHDIATDGNGFLYVVDVFGKRVQRFKKTLGKINYEQ